MAAIAMLFTGIFSQGNAQASMNMTLLGNWDDNNLPAFSGTVYNDIWGYAANGREYAIIGSIQGLFVIDVTTPSTPTVAAFEQGSSNLSLWRDFKTYQNYLYAVSDQGSGSSLQVYDLSNLPASITKVYDSQAFFTTCHNIFISESSGRLYAAGTTTNASGVVILDIATNPALPTLLATPVFGSYVHDIFVQNDTVVAFMGNSATGMFDFADISNPSLIDLIFTYTDPGYSHSGWATGDLKHLYWATETHGTSIKISDFTNGFNLDVVGTFKSEQLAPAHTNSVPHNLFIQGDYLYTSYYHDGVVVFDISNRLAPTIAGYYDTYPSNTNYNGFRGCWGVYPYLPSGNIIASDTENGLFILGSNLTFPVEMSNFRAEVVQDRVRLSWTTLNERNNDRFEIERSWDGESFEKIAQTPGNGDTDQASDYEFFDNSPLDGRSYYRLKQVDTDGEFAYTEVVSVRRGEELRFIGIYPNPAGTNSEIQFALDLLDKERVEFVLTDMMGRVLHQEVREVEAGFQQIPFSTAGWAEGTYLVKASAGSRTFAQKLLVQR